MWRSLPPTIKKSSNRSRIRWTLTLSSTMQRQSSAVHRFLSSLSLSSMKRSIRWRLLHRHLRFTPRHRSRNQNARRRKRLSVANKSLKNQMLSTGPRKKRDVVQKNVPSERLARVENCRESSERRRCLLESNISASRLKLSGTAQRTPYLGNRF